MFKLWFGSCVQGYKAKRKNLRLEKPETGSRAQMALVSHESRANSRMRSLGGRDKFRRHNKGTMILHSPPHTWRPWRLVL